MSRYIVYCTTCTENQKIYIGVHKTTNPNIFDNYIGCGCYTNEPSSYKYSKTVFQRAVNKYGPDKFKRKIIACFDNEEDAYNLEADIVNEEFLKRTDVYNTCLGGHGGDRGLNAKPCYQYDLEGNFVKEFSNRQEASRYVNRGFTTIKRAISDKIKAANSFWSEEKVEKLDISKYKTTSNRIPIFQYSESGEYDCCYESISDASRVTSFSLNRIRESALLGISCEGKYFSFEFDLHFSNAKYKYLYEIPVYLYSITGEYINSYINIKDAQTKLNIKKDLFKYIRLNKPYKELYQFSYEKLASMPDKSIKKSKKRKIAQYDLNDNLIKIWDSVSDCVKVYGTGVKHCLSGRNHQSKGFKYKYIENS